MPTNQKKFKKYTDVESNKNQHIEGLDAFAKELEKHFFATAIIRDFSPKTTTASLVIEMQCNYELTNMLHYQYLGTWGNFQSENRSFYQLFETLKDQNNFNVEIEKFSFLLVDTSIIIGKIFDKSICEQLETILITLSKNYIHLTRGLTELPYEIYIPVFEESPLEDDTSLMNVQATNNKIKDYFKYWGLYFNSEEDALVYDLRNTSIISGGLENLKW